jgi:NitT/TauT family transport system permease protein/putative hydroxymethylpyrimidine transport system permease protein
MTAAAMSGWRNTLPAVALPLISVSIALVAVELLKPAGFLPRTIPAPSELSGAFATDPKGLLASIVETVKNAAAGYLIAVAAALGAASLATMVGSLRSVIYNFGVGLSSVPLIAATPLLAVWLGNGPVTRSLIAALASYFPILVGAMQGFRAYEHSHVELLHVYSASRWRLFRLLILPSSVPYLFAGLKLAAPLAVLGSLTAELTGAETGLGVLMLSALFNFNIQQVWVTVLIACALSGGGYAVWAAIERVAIYWNAPVDLRSNGMAEGGRRLQLPAMVIVALVMFVLVWQAAIVEFAIPAYLLPRPSAVGLAFVEKWPLLLDAIRFTLSSALIGLAVSAALAIALATTFVTHRRVAQASMPLVFAFRSAPVTAIAPLIMLFVGRGMATSIIVVVIVSFFPILVNMIRGLISADARAVEMLHVYGASRWQHIRYVQAPYALPYVFTGLRIAAASAILGAMLAEWVTGSHGLGFLILESGDMREVELLWAAVITSVIFALAIFYLTSIAESAVLHWKGEAR